MLSIAFTGDISFSVKFKDSWKNEFVDTQILQFLNTSDYVVANIECPITNRELNSDRKLNHVSNPQVIPRLMEMNTNIWNLSNNHILDCGVEGALDTIEWAHKYGCKTVGIGKNLTEASEPLVLDDSLVGIMSVLQPWTHIQEEKMCITWDKEDIIKEKISELRKKVKWIVVVVHGGEEFSSMPMPWTRKRYLNFLEWGADVVVGHHPHVVQNYEIVGKKMIFYSLGNFIFDTDNQRDFKYTDKGVLLKLCFSNEDIKWNYIGTQIDREKQSVVVGLVPDIFVHICSWDYMFLWPVAAKQFVKNDDYKMRKLNPIYNKMSDFEWKMNKLKSYRYRYNLILLIGCILYRLKIGFFSRLKTVYNYLSVSMK